MQTEKSALREQLAARRKHVSASHAQQAGTEAQKQLAETIDWRTVNRVHLYGAVPALGEIPTGAIYDWLSDKYPDVEIVVGEAKPGAEMPLGDYDIIIVPVLGFDADKYRLGMGGGWYDRWLVTQPQAQKIGLAYEWARLDALPREKHDVPLDIILEL